MKGWWAFLWTLTLVSGRPISRKYITIRSGPNRYYGDMNKHEFEDGNAVPVLKPLDRDVVFDVSIYDQFTVEENVDTTVTVNGGERVVRGGDKIRMWIYSPQTSKFQNVLSLLFANDADYRLFKRLLQQYVNG